MPRESDQGHARQSLSRGSLSGDLLGKFSAIVRPRRTSHAGDNNGAAADIPILDFSDAYDHSDPSFSDGEGTTPSASTSSKGFGFMRRFSRATTPFAMVLEGDPATATLRRVVDVDEPERQRRFDLETMSFALLHEHFQPPHGRVPEVEDGADDADDNQVEEALFRAMVDSSVSDDSDDDDMEAEPVRRKSRETTTDADEYAALDDDDDRELVLRLKRRHEVDALLSASASHDDDDDGDDDNDPHDDDDDNEDDNGPHHDELNFDPENLPASVRKLVRQIENASFCAEPGSRDALASGCASGASNQDEEEPSGPPHPDRVDEHDEAQSGGRASAMAADAYHWPRHSDPLAHGASTKAASRRITYPLVVNNNHFRAPPSVPAAPFAMMHQSCYIPMDEVQEDLTKSVRRLVIGLKQEADAQADAPPSGLPFSRRRGNSCPPPYCPPAPNPSAVTRGAMPAAADPLTAAASSMDTIAPQQPEGRRWRKRSTLSRLAPKFLDTFRRKRKSYLYTDEELESIEGARWKIVELAFRFGGKHREYLVQAVNMFFPLIKYGRHGGPHPTRLHCNQCGTLQWQHKRGGLSEAVDLAAVLQVIDGRQTAVFRKYVSCHELDSRSLSLIFQDRTLDLETQSASHRDWLMSALRTLVAYAKRQREAEHRAIAEQALLPLDDLSESSASTRSRVELLARMHAPDDGSNVHGAMRW